MIRKLVFLALPATILTVVVSAAAIEAWVRWQWDYRRGTPGFYESHPSRIQRLAAGYDGWFGLDQFTYRMDPVKGMSLSRELFANCMKKALVIYAQRDQLEAARNTGQAENVVDVVKKVIYNG